MHYERGAFKIARVFLDARLGDETELPPQAPAKLSAAGLSQSAPGNRSGIA